MRKLISVTILIIMTMLAVARVHAQDSGDKLTVNFSDPSRQGLLKVSFINGGITVKTHASRDITIEGRSVANRNRRPSTTPDGLRRIDGNVSGLTIEEENNVMTVSTRGFNGVGNLEIEVPAKTNLNLRTINGGAIVVEGVEGELEVTNTNGDVMLNNVSGSVIAHATNGRLVASFREVTPNRPMSFTTMNANVDLTLPANAKANLKMRTDNGEVYSDFDVQLKPNTPPVVEDNRSRGGRFRIETDKSINGTINGGGPEFEVRTLNGNIYIRKAK